MRGEFTSIVANVTLYVDPLAITPFVFTDGGQIIQVYPGNDKLVATMLYVPNTYIIEAFNSQLNANIPTDSYIFGVLTPSSDVKYSVHLSVTNNAQFQYGYWVHNSNSTPAVCMLGITGYKATTKAPNPTGDVINLTVSTS